MVTFSDGKSVTVKNGRRGAQGEPGYTPQKGVDYDDGKDGDPFTYEDFTQEQLDALRGKQGPAGKTPVKGTDYWTAEDQASMVQQVIAALPDASEVSY